MRKKPERRSKKQPFWAKKKFQIVHSALKSGNIIGKMHKNDLPFPSTFRLAAKMLENGELTAVLLLTPKKFVV